MRCEWLLLTLVCLPAWSTRALEQQRLAGHVPVAVARLQSVDRLPATDHLDLALGLPLRNQSQLDEFLRQLYNPRSTNFHRYLTPREFTEAFGPTEQEYQAAIDFAVKNGFTVTATHSNRMLLNVRGSVERIENAFHLRMGVYPHPEEARRFYAPNSEPTVSSGPQLLHVSGLSDYHRPTPRIVRQSAGEAPAPRLGSGPKGTWFGKDFRQTYVPGTSLTGAGQVVGLFELEGYFPSDIASYVEQAGLPSVPLENVLIDGFSGITTNRMSGGGSEEVALDIEMTVSMAPGLSKVLVYEGAPRSGMAGVNHILNRMATDNLAKQLSCSWAFDIDATTQQIFQEYAAQGQSFFVASGDYGAIDGHAIQPADNPYITVVGGTSLATDSSSGFSETAWSGSGGGVSTLYSIPEWQQGIDMTLNGGSTTMRNYPDVAMVAEHVWVMANRGQSESVNGTSISAPLWAGFTALINEQAATNGLPPVGFLNPALYAVARGENGSVAFRDIVAGNNTNVSSPSNYLAVAGYDLCTGLGTPAGTSLINALLAPVPQHLVITPPLGLVAFGPVGGAFNVTSETYVLTNAGGAPLDWTVTNPASWLDVSPSSGTLLPGGPATPVTVTLDAVARNLLLGEFSAQLRFTDVSNGEGQTRPFRLLVGNGGFETGDFADWTFQAQHDVNFADSLDRSFFQHGHTITGVNDFQFVHSGLFGAFLGQNTSPGSISQTLPTLPGVQYRLSFWLDNPAEGTPNLFQAFWNGAPLYDGADLGPFAWTNLQYVVTAADTNSTLEFRFQNDKNAFGLDDVVLEMIHQTAALAVEASPAEGGLAMGSGSFEVGSQQQISAAPAPGWLFAEWNDGNQENPRTVTVPSGGATFTAAFAHRAEIQVLANPSAGGLVNGAGAFPVGSQQQISAVALPGWAFVEWSDGNRDLPRTITIPEGGATFTAKFVQTLHAPELAVAFSTATRVLDIVLTGTAGVEYVLESSDDLQTWAEVQRLTIHEAGTGQTSLSTATAPARFFRAIGPAH